MIATALVWAALLGTAIGGHEVVLPYTRAERWAMRPGDITIVQFDSRPLDSYWNASVMWNAAYAMRFGHNYTYMSLRQPCHYKGVDLSPSWCKVKAMVDADRWDRTAKVMVFLDSDAIFSTAYSANSILSFIQASLHWNFTSQPVAFNQDGPGYACATSFRIGYPLCLNSGTVVWARSKAASSILEDWWRMAGRELSATKFPMNWKTKWPWEQAAQYKVYAQYEKRIMLLSFPHFAYLPWGRGGRVAHSYPEDTVEPWCLSHWPGAGCFITHFCASAKQKQRLADEFRVGAVAVRTQFIELQ